MGTGKVNPHRAPRAEDEDVGTSPVGRLVRFGSFVVPGLSVSIPVPVRYQSNCRLVEHLNIFE